MLVFLNKLLTLTNCVDNIRTSQVTDYEHEEVRELIYDNVKNIREAKGVSASHVARKLGLTPQGYYYIEAGQVDLKVERLKVIAEILNEDVAIFFDDKLTDSVLERINGEAVSSA